MLVANHQVVTLDAGATLLQENAKDLQKSSDTNKFTKKRAIIPIIILAVVAAIILTVRGIDQHNWQAEKDVILSQILEANEMTEIEVAEAIQANVGPGGNANVLGLPEGCHMVRQWDTRFDAESPTIICAVQGFNHRLMELNF